MASIGSIGEESFISRVESVRTEIRDKFLRLHKLLNNREANLLAELQDLEDAFIGNGIARQIKHLTRTKDGLTTSLKGSEDTELLERSLAPINANIRELKHKLQTARDTYNSVAVKWDEDLEESLSVTGGLLLKTQRQVRDYKNIKVPVATFGTHSKSKSSLHGLFSYPSSITINPENNYLYITDGHNNRVQVFDKYLKFVFLFSENMNFPNGICIHQTKVYVTQFNSNCLNVYSIDGKYQQSVGRKGNANLQFKDPKGLDVSPDMRRIYVADSGNDRIHCLNLDFTFNSLIKDISKARDVKISQEAIVVLSSRDSCISLYSFSHRLIREMIPLSEGYELTDPVRIAVDRSQNILITDGHHHCVCVYSRNGEFIHKFGRKGDEKGRFIFPTGITVSPEGCIGVISWNPNQCVQIF